MTLLEGVGVSLRSPHIEHVLSQTVDIPWFELLTDNWLEAAGINGLLLDEIVERYPVALHGVSMNLGGMQPLDQGYLDAIKRLARRCQTDKISDHVCFTAVDGKQLHDLAPLPLTQETLSHLAQRINQVQDVLACPLYIENVSAYVRYECDAIDEASFLNTLTARTGCKLLLDINNLYVNQVNLGTNAENMIDCIDPDGVGELHLGGHQNCGSYLLDAHNNIICEDVWRLFERAIQRFGDTPTLIEWDNDLPEFSTLQQERYQAIHRLERTLESRHAA
ncbi:MAG: DUF692 domain-containing protein [Pseudomonadota bacterium]